ncbi:hypothetical protein Tco_1415408 [Tanacetum coccineum]
MVSWDTTSAFSLGRPARLYTRLIGKVKVGTAFMSKGDNEVPFEFKTECGSLLEQAIDELDRGVKTRKKGEEKDTWELTASEKIET